MCCSSGHTDSPPPRPYLQRATGLLPQEDPMNLSILDAIMAIPDPRDTDDHRTIQSRCDELSDRPRGLQPHEEHEAEALELLDDTLYAFGEALEELQSAIRNYRSL